MKKIKCNDEIIVVAGKDKGRNGKVQKVFMLKDKHSKKEKGPYVLVEGINVAKKHQKANPQMQIKGGIVNKEMPLHISNVALFNEATQKGSKVGIKTLEDGKKVRYFKSTGEVVDV